MRLSVKERDGFRVLLLGPEGWTEQAAARYAADGCDGVVLTGRPTDRPLRDLDFVRSLQGLRSFAVGATPVKDVSALFDKPELEDVGFGLNVPHLRGIGRLTRLRAFAGPFRPGIEELAGVRGLETLSIEEWPRNTHLDVIGRHPTVTRLWLHLRRGADLAGSLTMAFPALTSLSLYFGRLAEPDGLRGLHGLRELRFAGTKVADLGFVAGLPELRSLELDGSGDVASVRPLADHPRLEELFVIGDTTIVDGDLDPLLRLPAVRVLAVERGRSHYNRSLVSVRR
ncbi:leucine-rich repeat domain-containing protein [Asanoa hainanensis]|nr:leucine-rich repeat domain-containing protein [Asanoa hainanensis]